MFRIRYDFSRQLLALCQNLAQEVRDAGAHAIAVEWKERLRQRNLSRPTRGNMPHSGYWGDVSESITSRSEGDTAIVEARGPGVRMHLKGGTIRAKKKALAIPVHPKVADVWPREYSARKNVVLIPGRREGRAYLFEKTGSGKKGKMTMLWMLIPSVRITAKPDILLPKGVAESVANEAAQAVVEAIQV